MSAPLLRLLPSRPNLRHLRGQARDLYRSLRAGDAESRARLTAASVTPADPGSVRLTDCQLVLAREYGFPSWPRLKRHLEDLQPGASGLARIFQSDLGYYEERAAGLRSLAEQGLASIVETLAQYGVNHVPSIEEARDVVARMHGSPDWGSFAARVAEVASTPADRAEPFRAAFLALEKDDAPALLRLLRSHRHLSRAQGMNGHTLLNLAGSFRAFKCIPLLLAAGADPNAPSNRGLTPLHGAAYGGHTELARQLLAAGGSPALSAYGDGGTPLVFALFWGYAETAAVLATAGVAPDNLRVAAGLGSIDAAARFFGPGGSLLPEAGRNREFYRPHRGFHSCALTDTPGEILGEALTYASRNGKLAMLGFMLERGANVDAEPYNGTALHWAAARGRLDAVEYLLDRGAEIDRISRFGGVTGVTPLHVASAWEGRPEVVQLLLDRGADPNIRDAEHHSPPWGWASFFGNDAIRRMILPHAARTDLFAAVATDSADAVRQLLEWNPGAVEIDTAWSTPLGLAVNNGCREIVELLLQAGADPRTPSRSTGQSPLQAAEGRRDPVLCALLRAALTQRA